MHVKQGFEGSAGAKSGTTVELVEKQVHLHMYIALRFERTWAAGDASSASTEEEASSCNGK